MIIYERTELQLPYQEFCLALKQGYDAGNIRYMILDNNVDYFGGDIRMLQQFVVTNLPDAVFYNDFGEDYHTCMDAFGEKPHHSIFSNKIIIYDMKNFTEFSRIPMPYYNDNKMSEFFDIRWKDKLKSLK